MTNMNTPIYQYSKQNATYFRFSSDGSLTNSTWTNDGIAFFASKENADNLVPIYEHYAGSPKRYLYSPHPKEGHGWTKRDVAFYASATETPNTKPFEQFYKVIGSGWYFRYSVDEQINDGWTAQGTSFYAPTPKAVPPLSGGEGVWLTLGPTDYSAVLSAEGEKKAVMVFVDFPDTKTARGAATIIDAVTLGKQLVGPNGEAAKLFKDQSNEKFTLKIDVKSDLGWIDLGENSSEFLRPAPSTPDPLPDDYKPPKRGTDVSKLKTSLTTKFPSIDFSKYDMTFIVLPKNAAEVNPDSASFHNSPSYTGDKAIVFGQDSYKTFYAHLVHEVGHQIGLPDLYPGSSVGDVLTEEHKEAGLAHSVGCWSNMACMLNSLSFLGWERHKLGWLDASRKLFLESPPDSAVKYTLTPLTKRDGVGMIILPIDNLTMPSKVLVVEIAQDSYGIVEKEGKLVIKKDGEGNVVKNQNTGVLIYTVDAKVKTGHLPIQIIPRKFSKSDEYQELWEAPLRVDDSKEFTEGNFKVKVSIDQKVGDQYVISISKVVDSA